MADIVGVLSDAAKPLILDWIGGLAVVSEISYFKVGEGGWIDPGSGAVPRDPDSALTDLDVIINPGSYPAEGDATFQKSFIGGDITKDSDTTLSCKCLLDTTEFNDDGYGNFPELWEIGVFNTDNVMIGYGTYPIFIKNGGVQFLRYVKIDIA